jgi:hypothetical protein
MFIAQVFLEKILSLRRSEMVIAREASNGKHLLKDLYPNRFRC